MYSTYLTEKYDICEKLVGELLKKYQYVSLLGKHIVGKQIRVNPQNKSIGDTFEKQCGFVVKVFDQEIFKEYSFANIDDDNFNTILENIENGLHLSNKILSKHMKLTLLKDEPLQKEFIRDGLGKKLTVEERIAKQEELVKKMISYDPRIIQAISLSDHYEVSAFFISKNRRLKQYYEWNNVISVAVARDGANIKDARGVEATNNLELDYENALKNYEKPCKLALELLNSTPIEPGVYDIITHPSITGLIAHEAFGHGVEMDMFVKHRAKSRLYINKPVGSKILSMRDGANSIYSCASYFFDDDGVLAHDTLIIDKGILVSGISDSVAANELNQECTGNSRRESPFRKAYTRMTNTFFCEGDSEVEDMIKSIKHGYMLFQTDNGMEDPKNWNIQCVAQYGREIKDGKFTGKIVSPVVLSGYVPDLLMSISMISKNVEVIGSGHCGKGYKEWVPVSDGGAYLKCRCKLS